MCSICISFFCSGHSATPLPPFPEPLPPSPPPFLMWKQPFSCGDFLSFHPDAWHSWQIGCGSEGDGLWKQCPCPPTIHTAHVHEGSRPHKHTDIVRVCTQSHTQYPQPLSPALRQSRRLCCKWGDDLDVIPHKEKKTGNGNFDLLQLQLWLQHVFSCRLISSDRSAIQ